MFRGERDGGLGFEYVSKDVVKVEINRRICVH